MYIYSLPQEIEVWYIIPAIRRELARLLTKEYGLSYDKAAVALGVSKAAISQYNKNKRASNVRLHKRVLKEIRKSSLKISKNKDCMIREMLRVLDFMRKNKLPFEYCKTNKKHNHEECEEISFAYEKYWNY